MDYETLARELPRILDQLYPGTREELVPGAPVWSVSLEGGVALVGAISDPPQVRVTAGVAVEVPHSPGLFQLLSEVNHGLLVGRAYAFESGNGWTVVQQEIIWASALDMESMHSLQDLASRMSTVLRSSARVSGRVVQECGGRLFESKDAYALLD